MTKSTDRHREDPASEAIERVVFGSVANAVIRGSSHPMFLLPVRDKRHEADDPPRRSA